jgi:hypothetical protein
VRTAARLACGLGLAAALCGCTQHMPLKGKVIQGSIAFIGAVDTQDPRLTGPGLEGATVTALGTGQRTGATVATATSNARGDFRLVIADERSLLGTVEFWGRKAGYLDARTTMAVPGSDRTLLVILPEAPAGASGGR